MWTIAFTEKIEPALYQIASGIWTLLTLNVDALPQMPLEQWQTLFGIIAETGAVGSFAAVKSFEVRCAE